MKKLLSYLLILLMMLSVVFVSVSCNNQPKEQGSQTVEMDKATKAEHTGTPILPRGTGAVIPKWGVADDGVKNLPDIVTDGSVTNVSEELKAAMKQAQESGLFDGKTVNKVIVIIGDGMGVSHLDISREYKGELIMDSFPYITQSKTLSYDKASKGGTGLTTTDSTAGGTQILTGYKTRYGYIALDIDGNPVDTLAEVARDKNWKTAVVTNDHIGDATPADTFVHNTLREHQQLIYFQEFMAMLDEKSMPDLLMGADWNMDPFFEGETWAGRLEAAEKKCIAEAVDETDLTKSYGKSSSIKAYYTGLTSEEKQLAYPFSIYYYIWSNDTDMSTDFLTWIDSGLETWISTNLPADGAENHVTRYRDFKLLVANTDFSKPVLGSFNYSNPKNLYSMVGYQEYSSTQPNFSEMVAYTLYQLDNEATAGNTGFFCMIENTYPDGWGHKKQPIGLMNEVQNTDEGVAIAVKYVLEHPDTLLIVTADHETGGIKTKSDKETGKTWKNDISLVKSTDSGHSQQNVPCLAFGAGASEFAASKIGAEHEGYVTGQVIGRLMGVANFGQPEGYPNK